MPVDFNTADKYSIDKAFTQVVFGNDAPLLEVELNEMQKIMKERVQAVVKSALSDGFVNKPALTYSGGNLTLPADTIVVNGQIFSLTEPMTIAAANGETVYLAVSEAVVTYQSALKKGGNLSGGSAVTNDMFDSRVNEETTRRVQRQVQLVKTNADATKSYLTVASIAAGAPTDLRSFTIMNVGGKNDATFLKKTDIFDSNGFTSFPQTVRQVSARGEAKFWGAQTGVGYADDNTKNAVFTATTDHPGGSVNWLFGGYRDWTSANPVRVFGVRGDSYITTANNVLDANNGDVYLNSTDVLYGGAGSGRTTLRIHGKTSSGVLELTTAEANADGIMPGLIQFSDPNITVAGADKRIAGMYANSKGATANNRGGVLNFFVKKDGVNNSGASANVMSLHPNGSLTLTNNGVAPAFTNKKLFIEGSDGTGVYTSAQFNDDADRPAVTVKGVYPEINIISNAVSNPQHGGTLRFIAYKDANRNTWQHWVLGTPGSTADYMDIGWANGDGNPHAGISRYGGNTGTGRTLARFHKDATYLMGASNHIGVGTAYDSTVGGHLRFCSNGVGGGDGAWIQYTPPAAGNTQNNTSNKMHFSSLGGVALEQIRLIAAETTLNGMTRSYGKVFIDTKGWGGNPVIDLAIGDTDTGFHQDGDGTLRIYANNSNTATITSSALIMQQGITFGSAGGKGVEWYANGTNYIINGNGDSATYSSHNIIERGWFGKGYRDYQDVCYGVYNYRGGYWDVKGGYLHNGTNIFGRVPTYSGSDFASAPWGQMWLRTDM